MSAQPKAATRPRRPVDEALCLRVDPIACDGRGLCADYLPELIRLDDWGYPIIRPGQVPQHLAGHAAEVVRLCPKLALRLEAG
ncbi:MAG: ferredoxin [Acidimicrobiales bacterium]|jgi:ferredoxin